MIWDNIVQALSSLWANKMRALLTMLGIIIGIGSVIAIVTVGDSLTSSINSSMQSIGVNNITVALKQKSDESSANEGTVGVRMFGPSSTSASDLLSDAMIEEYRTAFQDQIEAISLEESVGSAKAKSGASSGTVNVTGVNSEYQTANKVNLLSGRFIKDASDKDKKLAVIADTLAEELFGMDDPIGKTIELTIQNQSYTYYVVGVYQYEESSTSTFFSASSTTPVYIPLSAAKKISGSAEGYQNFTVVASSNTDTNALLENTKSFFASFYTRNASYTATAASMESMLDSVTEMMDTVKLAIAAIASISLLVGGIGVMNIMLVSITERTREIGTRKALGAKRSSIRLQFIVESMTICIVGGMIGVAVGIGLGTLCSQFMGYPARPSIMASLTAVLFSMAIGVFFGYYPANKAAKLDPIDALRYE